MFDPWMATSASRSEKLAATPRSAATIAVSPNSNFGSARVLKTPLSDETIWKRLKEAGFDEDSIKRRDKAALVAYIAKLEAEVSSFFFFFFLSSSLSYVDGLVYDVFLNF